MVPNSLVCHETNSSKGAHHDENWDPDWVEHTFSAWCECLTCKERVAVIGNGGVEPGYDENGMAWDNYFTAKVLWPMPDIFTIPAKCPENVSEKIRDGFRLFWIDPAASATRIRVAIERLLDEIGIKKRRKSAKGKFIELNLHQRIEEYAKIETVLGNQLMAVKWLGNTGSHEGTVTRDDLLDAFEVMEHVLCEIIEKRSANVAAIAKKMTKRHKPRR